jgi:hypothetical protein
MRLVNRIGHPVAGYRGFRGRGWWLLPVLLGALAVGWTMWPRAQPDPIAVAQIRCYAVAVALNEALMDRPAPEWAPEFEARFDAMRFPIAEMARLRTRHAPLVRPAVEQAQERRDAALASTSDTYFTQAWAAVRECSDSPSGTA